MGGTGNEPLTSAPEVWCATNEPPHLQNSIKNISLLDKITHLDGKKEISLLKGIVSRDFGGLQMILINRLCVPDVPLEVYSFLNLHLHIFF